MTEPAATPREIPFNYTSADDRQAVTFLLGGEVWTKLEELRARRVTGRSARLLMRVFGEILVHRRNPFLLQELVDSPRRRRRLLENIEKDLAVIDRSAAGEPLVLEVLAACRALADPLPRRGRRPARPAPAAGARAGGGGRQGERPLRPLHAGLPRHRRHRLAAPPAGGGGDARRRGAGGAAARGHRAAGAEGHPARRRHRADRRRRAAAGRLRGGQHREAQPHPRHLRAASFALRDGAHRPAPRCWSWRRASSPRRPWSTPPSAAWSSPPIRPAPGPAPSAATSPRTPAARTACSGAPASTTCSPGGWPCPSGRRWTVRRVDHQLRKILPDDTRHASRCATSDGALVRSASPSRGGEIRKKGLWKDITNKALGGLPGLQKEGTDGVITSAEFILYPEYEAKRTLCLEFFGADMDEASQVILELSRAFPFPNQGRGGAHGARALRRRVRAGHRLPGEGAAGRDPQGGAAHRRGGPHGRGGGARGGHASAPSSSRTPTPCSSRPATPPRPSASGPTARSWAPSPGAPTPSR